MSTPCLPVCCFTVLLLLSQAVAGTLGSAFTYQGRLTDSGQPANRNYDLRFRLFGVAAGGSVVAGPVTQDNVPVTDGLLNTMVDFGPAITGNALWLEIGIRPAGSAEAYVVLTPRQPLLPAPYAIYSSTAGLAVSASNLVGTLPEIQLPATVAKLNAQQTFVGSNAFTGVVSLSNPASTLVGRYSGNGAGLTNLNPSALSPGMAPVNITGNAATATTALTASGVAAGTVGTAGLQDGSVTTPKLANNAVTNPKLADAAVTTAKIADRAVTSAKIDWAGVSSVFWELDGNTLTSPGTQFLGTTDNKALEFKVNNARVLRLEPNNTAPTLVGGAANNTASSVAGAVIAGGRSNLVSAGADYAMIPGGASNTVGARLSLAAGYRAVATNSGSFVWADANHFNFGSKTTNQFRVRAVGGAEFVTALDAAGGVRAGVNLTATGGVSVAALTNTSPALELREGFIKVTGATNRVGSPVFIHRLAATNRGLNCTFIDHPLCNNDPNAILFVTLCENPGDPGGTNTLRHTAVVSAFYTGTNPAFTGATRNRWALGYPSATVPPDGVAYNILVIKP